MGIYLGTSFIYLVMEESAAVEPSGYLTSSLTSLPHIYIISYHLYLDKGDTVDKVMVIT